MMRRKQNKAFLLLALTASIGAAAFFGINAWVQHAAEPYIIAPEQVPEADAILILGARVYSDTQVSLMLNDRLEGGLALYEAGKAPKIIVSGDHGQKDYDEVNAMKFF